MVSYKYDSYGNIKQISGDLSLGKLNPFRYKGYYYDNESGMYYCKSRYYVAYWRRWLNMDRIEYLDNTNIGNINLFSYCNNNPVMMIDDKGNFGLLSALLVGAGILVSGLFTGLSSACSRNEDESFLGAFTGGFIDGAVGSIAVAIGAAGGAPAIAVACVLSFAGGFAGNAIGQKISYGDIDYRASALQGAFSLITNTATFTGYRKMGIVNGATFGEKFIDALKISPIGVATSAYFSYYSLPNPNSIRRKKNKNEEVKELVYDI